MATAPTPSAGTLAAGLAAARSTGTAFGGYALLDPVALYRDCQDRGLPADWFGLPNSFRCPAGRGPGTGHVLLSRAALDALDQTKSHDLTFAEPNGGAVTLKKIVVVYAKCLTPGYPGDPASAYLCEVADRRHFLARVPVDKAYNLRAADGAGYLAGTLNSGVAWTWAQLVADLATACGLTGFPALPFAPHGTPENFDYFGGSAWDALNDVMDRVGCVIRYDPTADTFAVKRLGAADADADRVFRDNRLTWDVYPVEPARGWRPQKVRVLFVRYPPPTGGTTPYYAKDITLTATAGVEAGTYVTLYDDLAALGATGTPSNSSTLDARAQERADDWARVRGQAETRRLRQLPGAVKDVFTKAVGSLWGEAAVHDRGGDTTGGYRVEVAGKPGGLARWLPGRDRVPVPFDGVTDARCVDGNLVLYKTDEEGNEYVFRVTDVCCDCPAPAFAVPCCDTVPVPAELCVAVENISGAAGLDGYAHTITGAEADGINRSGVGWGDSSVPADGYWLRATVGCYDTNFRGLDPPAGPPEYWWCIDIAAGTTYPGGVLDPADLVSCGNETEAPPYLSACNVALISVTCSPFELVIECTLVGTGPLNGKQIRVTVSACP